MVSHCPVSKRNSLLPRRFINGRGAQSALSINGKRENIVFADLVTESAAMGVPSSRVEEFFTNLATRSGVIDAAMRRSFVPEGITNEFRKQINKALRGLGQSVLKFSGSIS